MLRFSKMQGAGNDFVVIDGITQTFSPTSALIQALCDRHFGIGADQLLLLEKPTCYDVDCVYRIFNCDGAEVEMCGNGARCVAKFLRERGLTNKDKILAQTATRIVTLHYSEDKEVSVDMGVPSLRLSPTQFHLANLKQVEQGGRICYEISTAEGTFVADMVSMGNPHAVIFTKERPSAKALERMGRSIEESPLFPEKINVEFVTVTERTSAFVDVWERGAGITLACGTGACASAVSGYLRGLFDETVQLQLPGGLLTVSWDGNPFHSVQLKGPAKFVFDGVIDENKLLSRDKNKARKIFGDIHD